MAGRPRIKPTQKQVKSSERARYREAARLRNPEEYGRPSGPAPKWGPRDIPRIAAQIRKTLVGEANLHDYEIAQFYNLSLAQWYRYKAKYAELREACVRGEEKLASMVERKLIETAMGFSHPAVKIFQFEGKPIIVHHEQYVPPNVTAQVAFLKAKKREEYGDKLEHSGDPKSPVRFIIDGKDVTHLEPKGDDNGGSTEGTAGG